MVVSGSANEGQARAYLGGGIFRVCFIPWTASSSPSFIWLETRSGFGTQTRTLSKKTTRKMGLTNKAEFGTKVYSVQLCNMRHECRRSVLREELCYVGGLI